MEAIILAGGLGTRLQSRLIDLPKAMAPVAGRPFLQILLDRLVDAGCNRVILCVGHLRQVIVNSFGVSYRGVPISYAIEESPLGTGGAIRLGLEKGTEDSLLVLNGDTFLQVDFAQLCRAHETALRPLTMAITPVDNVSRYGGVIFEQGCVAGFAEKGGAGPGWINAGTYVISRAFPWPEDLPDRFSFESDVLAPHLATLRPAAFLCRGYFLDIGVPEDLDRAQTELAAPIDPADHGHQSRKN
ncbi:MAG TPA: nucleotidyltransferase family protein [Terracidiphilus sp.]|jgi:D-glycero-alpha-D-manno-heptose 1-phosphate guanylyltransferase|nr:nucleotidyltransferase family protein [Terracidiphilus sp.]